jgi:hypothetical protein
VLFNAGSHVIAMAVMLPATVMAGMTLPLFTFALLARGCGERSIGRIYAANTVGAIVGVLLAVHVVMPAVGTKGLILCGAGVDVVLGLVLLGAVRRRLRSRELVAAAAAAAVLFAAVGLGVRPDLRRTASGVYRYGTSELPGGAEVVFHRDGKTATIDLIRERDGTLKISTNGKPDARIAVTSEIPAPDEITMVMLAAVPLALHPEARTAAIVGLGSGLTTHTLLGADTLERVDTIEIEAAVLDAARGFGPSVERVWSDPRSRLHVEDAKAFLSSRGRRYDLILSEPSNPWVSGVASLFSEEFYRYATRHLEEDGLLVQWLQLYEINVDLLASVFKALSASFDDYTVFSADNANVVVAATNGGNLDRLDPTLFDPPRLRRDLARVGLKRIEDLELRRIGSRRLLHPVFAASGAPANSDYFPYLSLRAPRSRFLDENAVDLTRLHVAPVPVTEMLDPRVRRSPEPHSGDGSFSPARARRLAGQLVGSLVASQAAASHEAGRPAWYHGLQTSCVDPVPDEAALRDELTWLAAATNPYVRGPDLGRMWDRVASLVCEDRLSPRTRDWLRLHRAVADRDAPAMARIAAGLLQAAGDPPTRREVEYLLAAGVTGALAAGDREQASRLARRGAPLYPPGANPPFYLRLLLLQALGQST